MGKTLRQVRLGAIAVLLIVWTCLPIYHMVMLSLTPQTAAFAGRLWPDHPSLENYRTALGQGHPFLAHFWQQLLNSLMVAFTTCVLVLFIASLTSFALGRLRPRWAPLISNLALFTYLIPAAFLAIPLYRVMGQYGILNRPWSLILALVALVALPGFGAREDDRRWTQFSVADGLPGKTVWAIAVNPHQGDVWLGTNRGASVYRDGHWYSYTRAQGLAAVWREQQAAGILRLRLG